MSAAATAIRPKSNVPAKSIALPIEHGSWGFLFEPLALGLLLAPSISAPFISLFVIGAFMARQPLKFLLADWKQGRRLPRTEIALKFTLIFGGISAVGFIGSLIFAPAASFIPFVIAAPLAIYLISQDVARQSRELVPEILAAFALAASTAALIVADGGAWPFAIAMWGVMMARLIPSIIYVRDRLRMEKGKDYSRLVPIGLHVAALIAVGALAYFGLGPVLPVLMMAFLLGRAIQGMSSIRQRATAKQIGVQEVIYGCVTVLTVVVGYYLGV